MIIAASDIWEFWQIGQDVYRSKISGQVMDPDGLPLNRRWECTRSHWDMFREVFSWATDVA